jgi:hypothetical protein
MSFGWEAGNILVGIQLVKDVIEAIKDGPAEYQEICRELGSINIALSSVLEGVNDPTSLLNQKGRPRAKVLLEIVKNCKNVVEEVEERIDDHSSLKDNGRGKLRRV